MKALGACSGWGLFCACALACSTTGSNGASSSGGTSVDGGGDNGGSSSSSSSGGQADAGVPAECDALPDKVDADRTAGPGCVRVGHVEVTGNATLTIAAGTTVRMDSGGYLSIDPDGEGASLNAVGTETEPITFTSSQDTGAAGDWQCIHIGSSSSASMIEHAILEHGGAACDATGAGYEAMLVVDAPMRSIRNVTFRDSSTHGVMLHKDAEVGAFEQNHFADNADSSVVTSFAVVLSLGGGNVFDDADDFIEVDTTFSLEKTGTWTAQTVPWRLMGGLSILGGADVTIEPGALIQMTGGSWDVFDRARITAEGTPESPITFSSSREDAAPGDWGCISTPGAASSFRNVVFEYAGNGDGCTGANYRTALFVSQSLQLSDVTFRHISGAAIISQAECNTDWCASTFEDVDETAILCNYDEPMDCPR